MLRETKMHNSHKQKLPKYKLYQAAMRADRITIGYVKKLMPPYRKKKRKKERHENKH